MVVTIGWQSSEILKNLRNPPSLNPLASGHSTNGAEYLDIEQMRNDYGIVLSSKTLSNRRCRRAPRQ
jgi:hypothetical protein